MTRRDMLCGAYGRFDGAQRTESELMAKIVGQWVLCGGTSIFGTQEDGLEIAADGTWYKLHGSGPFARALETNQHGTYEVIEGGVGWYQLNLNSDLGTVAVVPQFTMSPVKMAVSNNGVYDAVYAAWVQPTSDLAADETLPASYTLNACNSPEPPEVRAATEQEFERMIIGRWYSCSGSVFGTGDDIGIELDYGGEFHELYRGPGSNIVVIGHGFLREGKWSTIAAGDVNGPGVFQLSLDIAGSGTMAVFPRVTTDPPTLVLTGAGTGRYVSGP